MKTIADIRKVRPYEYIIVPYVQKAWQLQVKREEKKQGFSGDAYTNSIAHFWGALGELLTAQLLGTKVDEAIYGDNSDHGVDFIWDNKSIDVKTVVGYYTNPELKVPINSKYWPDVYILLAVDPSSMRARFVGYTNKENLAKARRHRYGSDYRYPENYVMTESELLPMNTLVEEKEALEDHPDFYKLESLYGICYLLGVDPLDPPDGFEESMEIVDSYVDIASQYDTITRVLINTPLKEKSWQTLSPQEPPQKKVKPRRRKGPKLEVIDGGQKNVQIPSSSKKKMDQTPIPSYLRLQHQQED